MRVPRFSAPEILAVGTLFAATILLVTVVMTVIGHAGRHWNFGLTMMVASGGCLVLTGAALVAFGRRLRLGQKTIKNASGVGDAN